MSALADAIDREAYMATKSCLRMARVSCATIDEYISLIRSLAEGGAHLGALEEEIQKLADEGAITVPGQ